MAETLPFKVNFDSSRVTDLKNRLQRAIYPNELNGAGWDMGVPGDEMERIATHWATKFDFEAAAERLNKFPQFTTPIQCEGFETLDIHFIHVRSPHKDAIPLLFSHGWPGCFIEAFKIIEPLTNGGDGPHFHVVAPSLPNFGFSAGPRQRGFAIEQYAETCYELMQRLGYTKFATQGGDWGWYVTRTLSLLYPSAVIATHFNMDVGEPPASLTAAHPKDPHPLPANPTPRELEGKTRSKWFDDEGFGYNFEQGTKPQTLSYALSDSPLGLLAWIYEKLHDWTDNYAWTDDEICTWISIYWFSTAGPGAAGWIYYEMIHDRHGTYVPADSLGYEFEGTTSPKGALKDRTKVTRKWLKQDHGTGVKIGQSHFPKDIHVLPSAWTRTLGHVVFENEHSGGGHFAAWERPDDIVRDLKTMFKLLKGE